MVSEVLPASSGGDNCLATRQARLFRLAALFVALVGMLLLAPGSHALDLSPPYQMPSGSRLPQAGAGLPRPTQVFGKEFSHDNDFSVLGPNAIASPGQVVAWDGNGGVAEGVLLRPVHTTDGPFEIDALANHADTLFVPLLEDRTHLIFSVAAEASALSGAPGRMSVPSVGPLVTTSGLVLGGAAELSYELGTISPNPQRTGVWATRDQIVQGATFTDIDALELWGPDPQMVLPGETAAAQGDSDKFSIESDASLLGPGGVAYAIWNKGNRPAMPGYLLHSDLVEAVAPLLGWTDLDSPNSADVDVDALMVLNAIGTNPDLFDGGDQVLVSLRQIANPNGGFYTTGSELILLTHDGNDIVASFLRHNGHLWDKEWALQNMVYDSGTQLPPVLLDINVLEAASVPEPATVAVALGSLFAGWLSLRRRRQVA